MPCDLLGPILRADRFDEAAFLRDTWQQRPLMIRDPWVEWSNPIDPDELAGLACEEEVDARLIEQRAARVEVEQGPFDERRLVRRRKAPWTLLVQAVDHHVPQVAMLIEPFRFIPNWRIDDVMVSYATDGGGVGAHFDHYDVFLIQGAGRRRWQVGQLCDEATALLPHDHLRLVADFEPTDEWMLKPGDILYVPPRVAHHGVAVGDGCMTYSIGFRAPSRAELIAGWSDDALAAASDGDRYEDPGLACQDNPGEISGEAITRLQAMLLEAASDRDAFARWFGRYNSTRKDGEIDWTPDEPTDVDRLRDGLDRGVWLRRNPASRFSFLRQNEGRLLLFVDGRCFECSADMARVAERLCGHHRMAFDRGCGSPEVLDLLGALLDQGSIAFEEP